MARRGKYNPFQPRDGRGRWSKGLSKGQKKSVSSRARRETSVSSRKRARLSSRSSLGAKDSRLRKHTTRGVLIAGPVGGGTVGALVLRRKLRHEYASDIRNKGSKGRRVSR